MTLQSASCPGEIDYRAEYMRIALLMGELYPDCEVTTLDMVKLLVHECDTLRLALKIPTHRAAVEQLFAEQQEEA